MKPNQHKVLTRWGRFWFATGSLWFGLKGVPVEWRSLPEATPASPSAARTADAYKNTGDEQLVS